MLGRDLSIIRYLVAYVFLASGILKWITPSFLAVFVDLGLPFPKFTLLLVASIEIVAGSLLIFNLYVKEAVIALLIIIIGAIIVTKLPIILNGQLFSFAFEARLDIVMLFLLIIIYKKIK